MPSRILLAKKYCSGCGEMILPRSVEPDDKKSSRAIEQKRTDKINGYFLTVCWHYAKIGLRAVGHRAFRDKTDTPC